jgi:short-subunit dehydrogenase
VTAGTALITGASSGIGLELAKLFARDGYDLVLVARRREKLEALGAELGQRHGIRFRVIAADLADPAAPAEIMRQVGAASVTVDVLVNNAGFGELGAFVKTDLDTAGRMIEVNVTALTALTKLFLPGMLARRRGRILNVASTAGFAPGPLMAVYYATKAYVISLSEALAEELRGSGVSVTVLCPGPTLTEFQEVAHMQSTRLFRLPGVVMSGESVAMAGYAGLMRGKRMVVPGLFQSSVAARYPAVASGTRGSAWRGCFRRRCAPSLGGQGKEKRPASMRRRPRASSIPALTLLRDVPEVDVRCFGPITESKRPPEPGGTRGAERTRRETFVPPRLRLLTDCVRSARQTREFVVAIGIGHRRRRSGAGQLDAPAREIVERILIAVHEPADDRAPSGARRGVRTGRGRRGRGRRQVSTLRDFLLLVLVLQGILLQAPRAMLRVMALRLTLRDSRHVWHGEQREQHHQDTHRSLPKVMVSVATDLRRGASASAERQ